MSIPLQGGIERLRKLRELADAAAQERRKMWAGAASARSIRYFPVHYSGGPAMESFVRMVGPDLEGLVLCVAWLYEENRHLKECIAGISQNERSLRNALNRGHATDRGPRQKTEPANHGVDDDDEI